MLVRHALPGRFGIDVVRARTTSPLSLPLPPTVQPCPPLSAGDPALSRNKPCRSRRAVGLCSIVGAWSREPGADTSGGPGGDSAALPAPSADDAALSGTGNPGTQKTASSPRP